MKSFVFGLVWFIILGADSSAPLMVSEVDKEIKEQNIKFPKIVLAQALHETGNFKCKSCSLDRNNLFGFRYKKKYLVFDNWKESVVYYARWQSRHYKGGDYYEFLKDVGYATDPEYINRLKRFKL